MGHAAIPYSYADTSLNADTRVLGLKSRLKNLVPDAERQGRQQHLQFGRLWYGWAGDWGGRSTTRDRGGGV